MIHTTEQARELWCPMARGIPAKDGVSRCMGSKCAMWRWYDETHQVFRVKVMCDESKAEIEPKRPNGLNPAFVFVPCDEDMDAHWTETEEAWLRRRRGYCGLAGRPEVMP